MMTSFILKVTLVKLVLASVVMSSAFLKSLWKATFTISLLSSLGVVVAKVLLDTRSMATKAKVLIESDIYLGFIVLRDLVDLVLFSADLTGLHNKDTVLGRYFTIHSTVKGLIPC